jgi:hypothetical protein
MTNDAGARRRGDLRGDLCGAVPACRDRTTVPDRRPLVSAGESVDSDRRLRTGCAGRGRDARRDCRVSRRRAVHPAPEFAGQRLRLPLSYSQTRFNRIDGRSLLDGTLVATSTQLDGESGPFDTETLTLEMETRVLTVSGHFGVTDRFDVIAALPFVNVSFAGERVDTYRGTPLIQATASGSAFGTGDLVVRAKYNVARVGASGVSLATDIRFPTGTTANLLGGGETVVTPRATASWERGRIALHAEGGYAMGGASNAAEYGAALTVAATPRLTLVGEFIGRRIESGGRLIEITEPHPDLPGVHTTRLTGTLEPTTRAAVVAGFRWNVAARSLISVSVLRPITSAGLNAPFVATMTFDYSIGR